MLAKDTYVDLKTFLDRMERTFEPDRGFHERATGLLYMILDGIGEQPLSQDEIDDRKKYAYDIAEEGFRNYHNRQKYAHEITHLKRLLIDESDPEMRAHYLRDLNWKQDMHEDVTSDTFTCLMITYGALFTDDTRSSDLLQ